MRVAIVRGPNLNPWELANYDLPVDVEAIASRRGAFASQRLTMPTTRLPCPDDVARRLPNPVEYLVRHFTGDLQYLFGLERVLRGVDIAHVADLSTVYSLQAIRARDRGHCRRVVATGWENIPVRPVENRFVERRTVQVASGIDHVLAISERARLHLELAGVPPERISVVPMGIDLERFTPSAGRPAAGPLEILSVARMQWEKGVEDLVIAVKLLADREIEARLTLVGEGYLTDRLPKLARRLGISERVRLVGSLDYQELPALHRQTDVFVLASTPLPTWREQFGFAVVEAMASGLPVLAGNSGSLPEVVDDPGQLVTPHDPAALADGLAWLAGDPSLRRALGERNRERAVERFDRRKIAKEILALYRHILAE